MHSSYLTVILRHLNCRPILYTSGKQLIGLTQKVGGGISGDRSPREQLIVEAMEEAGLSSQLSSTATATGAISFCRLIDASSLCIEVDFTFELMIPATVVPSPVDGEVASFQLMRPDEVMALLLAQKFAPAASLVLTHFLVQHGFIHSDNEEFYVELVSRLHQTIEPFDG